MPSLETSIWLSLKARIDTLVLTPALGVAWPRQSFIPPHGGLPILPKPYLEIRHLPNINTRRAIGNADAHRRTGILQITLKYPVSLNHSEAVATEIVGKIAEHFPAGLPMTYGDVTLQVEKAPDIASSFRNGTDPYWQTPVSIRYRAFA